MKESSRKEKMEKHEANESPEKEKVEEAAWRKFKRGKGRSKSRGGSR